MKPAFSSNTGKQWVDQIERWHLFVCGFEAADSGGVFFFGEFSQTPVLKIVRNSLWLADGIVWPGDSQLNCGDIDRGQNLADQPATREQFELHGFVRI